MILFLIILILHKVKNDRILFKFADNKNLSIEKDDIGYENFEFLYSKIERWNDNQIINIPEMTIELFELIIDVYKKDGYVLLSDDNFADFITGIDFLGIRECVSSDESKSLNSSNCLSAHLILNEINNLLNNENPESQEFFEFLDQKILEISKISSLGFKNVFILKLFEKYLQLIEKDSKVEFKNGLLRCYIKKVEPGTVPTCIDIKYYYKGVFCYIDIALDKIITWIVKALNLPRIMFTSNNRKLTILFFDTIKNERNITKKSCLSETLNIIKNEWNPSYLNLVNVISHGDDLKMFETFKELETLKVQNNNLIDVKISDFEIENLKSILFVGLKISIQDFNSSSIFCNLNSLECYYSEFIDDDGIELNFNSSITVKKIYLQECKLDNIFFDWFNRISGIEKLEFYNNVPILNDESAIILDDRALFYKDPCFSEKQLKILTEKSTLCFIKMICKKHDYKVKAIRSYILGRIF